MGPQWPPRPCTFLGCAALVQGGSRCPAHPYAPRVYDQQARDYDRERGSARERGYGHVWKRVRDAHLRRQPLCQYCLLEGVVKAAEMVDHIVEIKDGGARFKTSNLQSLCNSCHRRKTEATRREREASEGASARAPRMSQERRASGAGPRVEASEGAAPGGAARGAGSKLSRKGSRTDHPN